MTQHHMSLSRERRISHDRAETAIHIAQCERAVFYPAVRFLAFRRFWVSAR